MLVRSLDELTTADLPEAGGGRDDEPVWDREPGPSQLAEIRTLAARLGQIRGGQLIERPNEHRRDPRRPPSRTHPPTTPSLLAKRPLGRRLRASSQRRRGLR